jgi:hypothetical protein
MEAELIRKRKVAIVMLAALFVGLWFSLPSFGGGGPSGTSGVSADPLAQIKEYLSQVKTDYASLMNLRGSADFTASYKLVQEMQDKTNKADELFLFDLTASQQSIALNDLVKLHVIMACAATYIDDEKLFELHDEYACRLVRKFAAIDPDKCLEAVMAKVTAADPADKTQYEARRAEYRKTLTIRSPRIKIRLDRSSKLTKIDNFAVAAVPPGRNANSPEDTELYAKLLDKQLLDPIVKNWFLVFYEADARARKIALEPIDYIGVPNRNREKTQFVKEMRDRFEKERYVDLSPLAPAIQGLAMPDGTYYFYPRNMVAPGSPITGTANLVLQKDKIADQYAAIMRESGTQVDVVGTYEQRGISPALTPRSLIPKFKILNLSFGTNRLTGGLEGSGGGQMFQQFGSHIALQTNGMVELRQNRDWMDLDRFSVFSGNNSKYIGRDARSTFDSKSKEFQLDIGPVMRFGPAQFAVMESLRYVKRDGFDKGGTIGQFFINGSYLFKHGQIGFYATLANSDEPVVRSVQFDQTLFEETYLKVVDQMGINFQTKLPRIPGYMEGAFGYLRPTLTKSVPGGTVRYVGPLPWVSKRLSFTAEVGYNEGFIRSNDNSLRIAGGLRYGRWAEPPAFLANDGPVPVVVPSIRYETMTRLVRKGNRKPIADAGQDQLNVDWRQGEIFLDGSKSTDPDDDSITFAWSQTKGTSVDLKEADTSHPHFTPGNGEEYEFKLIVKDSFGLESDPDYVRVTTLRIDKPEINSFTVQPVPIRKGDNCQAQSATLSWDAKADNISVTNIGTRLKPIDSRQVSPDSDTTYTITACNLVNECVSASVTLTVRPCLSVISSFTATPPEIMKGSSSKLDWATNGADRVTLNGQDVDKTGSTTVSPTQTTVYRLNACNAAGECENATVTVTVKSVPNIVAFKADPSEIYAGTTSKLSWEVTNIENGDTISLTNGVRGTTEKVPPVITDYTVQPDKTTTYVLTACKASGECVSAQATVTVKTLPVIRVFTATPSEIYKGGSSTLNWTVENADRVTLTNYGDVAAQSQLAVTPSVTTTYVLTACKASGECVSAHATITVKSIPVILVFTATPPEIYKGESSTLKWTVENADRVTLTNYGDVAAQSQFTVTPNATTTYVLTACKASGECVSAQVTVTVKLVPVIRQFTAYPPEIDPNGISTLTYRVDNADRVTITNYPGSLDPKLGSVNVTPLVDTIYTLTACNEAGECVNAHATVKVKNAITIDFTADRYVIPSGQSANLMWCIQNAMTVTLLSNSAWEPLPYPPSCGIKTVTPVTTTNYTIRACNSSGSCVEKGLPSPITVQ